MLIFVILLLVSGSGGRYFEACRLLEEGRLVAGAAALRSLPPENPFRPKAERLLPVLEVLLGGGDYAGPRAPGRSAAGRLEFGAAGDGAFTAGLLGGEGSKEAYAPLLFGFPVPCSSRWTVRIDGEDHALPPRGAVRGPSASWVLDGVAFRLALAPERDGGRPPRAVRVAMRAVNRSSRTRRVGLRLLLDLADRFDDAPPLRAPPLGRLFRAQDWNGSGVPGFVLYGRNALLLRGPGLFVPDRLILCDRLGAENALWDFPLEPEAALGPDTAAVLSWSPRLLPPGANFEAAVSVCQGGVELDRRGAVASRAVLESRGGEVRGGDAMRLSLYLENSAPAVLDRLEDVEARIVLPGGLRLDGGDRSRKTLGDLDRGEGGRVSWDFLRTGEAGGRRQVLVEVTGKGVPPKRIDLPVDLPARRDLAGRTLTAQGRPLPGSEVVLFAAGRPLGRSGTDRAGGFRFRDVAAGLYELEGKKDLFRKPAVKRGHEELGGAVYDLTLDSDRVEDSGAIRRARAAVGEGRVLLLAHAVFRYNLLISVEWDADRAFLDNVVRGMRAASNYLYDALDGQVCFGKISVYDDARHWNDADMQVFAQNSVHANANVWGYYTRWEPGRPWNPAIHFGRSWNGGNWAAMFDVYPWDRQAMYRTIVHEFGHYGLGFYDEYLGRVNGAWRGLARREMCPSFMGYQYVIGGDYNADWNTEICFRGNHHPYTAQGIYRGMSCWEWVKHTHDGVYNGVPVSLISPAERGGVICPGPRENVGKSLAAFVHDADTGAFDATLAVAGPWGGDVPGIPVWTVVTSEGRKIFQGSTGLNGKIRILGVHAGDVVEAIHEGRPARMTLSERRPEYELQFLPYPSGPSDYPVLVSLLPERAGGGKGHPARAALTVEVRTPMGTRGAPAVLMRWGERARPIALDPAGKGVLWRGAALLDPGTKGEGSLETRLATPAGETLDLVTDFRLAAVPPGGCGAFHNFDGTATLRLAAGSLPEGTVLVLASSLVPPLDTGRGVLVGRIESIQGPGGPPRFDPPAELRLVIPSEAAGPGPGPGAGPGAGSRAGRRLSLRRWNGSGWEEIPSGIDSTGKAVLARIAKGGLLGLFE